jgi:aminoglycoside phosphotransferase (APT) family kinase protein
MSAPSISPAGLAGRHGLDLDAASVRVEEAGLDYRVAFARDIDGVEWVLRIPRRPDVSAKLAEEQRILAFVAPRLSMAVPRWEVCSEELIAYRRLPGEPGLTLDGSGQPVWHVEPSSPAFAAALGRLIAELQALDLEAARTAGIPASSMSEIRTRWRADVERVGAAFEIAPHAPRIGGRPGSTTTRCGPSPPRSPTASSTPPTCSSTIPSRIVGVLDWTTAKVGDPAADFTYQHMMGPAAFDATVAAYLDAGGVPLPHLAERCAALAAAAPLVYGLFALQTRDPQHRAAAAALLLPAE